MSNAEFEKYPVYQYIGGKIVKLKVFPEYWNVWEWQLHHFVKRQQVRKHPELERLQKLIFLPVRIVIDGTEHNMHAELHNATRGFKERYGIERSDLLYGAKTND